MTVVGCEAFYHMDTRDQIKLQVINNSSGTKIWLLFVGLLCETCSWVCCELSFLSFQVIVS